MMNSIRTTYDLAVAAGRDAGNRSMQQGGRKAWNLDDWNAAAAVTERLIKAADDLIERELCAA